MILITILYLILKKKPEKFSKCNNFNSEENTESSTIEATDEKIKAYNFNTSWCGYSRAFQENWDKFNQSNNDKDVEIIDVKCDDENNSISKQLCKQYPVRGYPTVLFVKGENVAEYSGNREPDDLEKALQNFKNTN